MATPSNDPSNGYYNDKLTDRELIQGTYVNVLDTNNPGNRSISSDQAYKNLVEISGIDPVRARQLADSGAFGEGRMAPGWEGDPDPNQGTQGGTPGTSMQPIAVNPYLDPSATPEQAAAWQARLTPEQQSQYSQMALFSNMNTANQGDISNLEGYIAANNFNNGLQRYDQANINRSLAGYDQTYAQQSQGTASNIMRSAADTNTGDAAALATYGGTVNQQTALNNQNFANLQNQYSALSTPLQSQTRWAGDLTSQASQAYADPASIQAQQDGLGMLGNSANGSLGVDYARLNPQLYAGMQQNLGQLQGVYGGNNDVNYAGLDPAAYGMVQNSTAGLYGVGNGSLDVNYQGLDPAAYGAVQSSISGLQGAGNGSLDVNYSALDPATLAAQQNALNTLGAYANGQRNVSVSASDPQAYHLQQDIIADGYGAFRGNNDIRRDTYALNSQTTALNDFYDTYKGGQDVARDAESWKAQQNALSGFGNVAGGIMDAKVGELDPQAYAAQKEALGQYSDLVDPRTTDAERFIYERERMGAEQTERANREGVMAGLRQRGMGGSGMELTNNALAAQQTSQNRLLANLGANANAVQRGMTALQGKSALSTDMVNSANALATSNYDRRLQGLENYGAQGNQMQAQMLALGSSNADRRVTGLQGAGAMANTMQDDAYKVNSANQATRMQGLGVAGQMNGQLLGYGVDVAQGNANRGVQAASSQGSLANQALGQRADVAMNNANNRLTGYQSAGSLANQSLGQQSQVAMSNANNRITGYQSAGSLANQSLGQQAGVATANQDRRVGALQTYGQLATQQYGQQANVATANMDRQLSAQQAYTTQAGVARGQSFDESYKRGAAADQTAQFNRDMSINVSQWNDKFAQAERDASWGRSTDLSSTGLATGQANAAMNQGLFNGTLAASNAAWGRNTQAFGAQDVADTRAWQANTAAGNRDTAMINQQRSDYDKMIAAYGGTTGMKMESRGATTNNSAGVWQQIAGSQAAAAAQQSAIEEAKAAKPAFDFLGLLKFG